METVLVTGVAGFIASHLTRFLLAKTTTTIIGVDKVSYCSSLRGILDLLTNSRFHFLPLDLTDEKAVEKLFTQYNITTVYHLAAYTHIDHSFREPLIFTKNNILGTHILLEQARLNRVTKFLHMSTDEVYGTTSEISYETSLLDPTNPYSASKAGAEIMVRSYWHSFKTPVVIIRANNIYGTHQYPEKVIPRFVKRLMEDEPCVLHGTGAQTRNFLHIDDLCQAILLLTEKGEPGQIYNVGSSDEISIYNLAKEIITIVKGEFDPKWLVCGEDRFYNDLHYWLDTRKIQSLGWKPQAKFNQSLAAIVKWYMVNQDYWQ